MVRTTTLLVGSLLLSLSPIASGQGNSGNNGNNGNSGNNGNNGNSGNNGNNDNGGSTDIGGPSQRYDTLPGLNLWEWAVAEMPWPDCGSPGQNEPFQGRSLTNNNGECDKINICHGNAGFGWNRITVARASLGTPTAAGAEGHANYEHNREQPKRPDYFPSSPSVPNPNGAGKNGHLDGNCNFVAPPDDDNDGNGGGDNDGGNDGNGGNDGGDGGNNGNGGNNGGGNAGNCNDGFVCGDCLTCKSATPDDQGTYTVVIDGYDCKGGDTISWMCAAEDGVTVEGASDENKNDNGLTEMIVYGVPGDWTTLRVQTKDGNGYGTDTSPLEQCGGGQGLQDTCSGACTTQVNLRDCMPSEDGGSNGGAGGDPHFKTWDGEWFDFHGECDLLLLDAPNFGNGLGMSIHVRTKIQHSYSYISSAVVRMGHDDGGDTFQVNSYGDYNINGIFGAGFPSTIGDNQYEVVHSRPSEHTHLFEILLNDPTREGEGSAEKLEVKTFKHMVSVNLKHTKPEHFIGSVGILGSYGTSEQGLRLARDGVTILHGNTTAYAMEWQVRPDIDGTLFDVEREPQFPQQCKMPKPADALQGVEEGRVRRLLRGGAISQEEAEEACAHYSRTPDQKARCVCDVLATQDLEFARMGGAF